MTVAVLEAKTRLDTIIKKGRVDLYKPIQIAEVLWRSRVVGDVVIADKSTYQNPSIHWRNEVTQRLTGKVSTSSARYQHDIWNPTAMPPDILMVLDAENRRTQGAVERYIYMRYSERQETVSNIIAALETATPEKFQLDALLKLFVTHRGIRRSIDKAYEIVAYSLFETVVSALGATIEVSVPSANAGLLAEFSDLARVLLGLEAGQMSWRQPAHLYRVGVTNAADRGLDMWANFGPAIQVKHLTLNEKLVHRIIDQIESEHIVIVCRDADAKAIQVITKQIGWGQRVRGIVRESDLIAWYERCLRGKFADRLARPLLDELLKGFTREFPQSRAITDFMSGRGYTAIVPQEPWLTDADRALAAGQA